MRVLVFGDSIAQGFFDSKGGWVQRLSSDLHMKTLTAMNSGDDYHVEIHNLGVSGDTAEGTLNRMESEMGSRRLYQEDEIIVIAIGTNDSALRGNVALEDVYDFQVTYEKILETAKHHAEKILCVGLPAVDESMSDPWKFSSTGRQYKNNRLDLFEDTVKQVAGQASVEFVPIFDVFLARLKDGSGLLADGLHPNDAGHELIYQIVKPKLEELLK